MRFIINIGGIKASWSQLRCMWRIQCCRLLPWYQMWGRRYQLQGLPCGVPLLLDSCRFQRKSRACTHNPCQQQNRNDTLRVTIDWNKTSSVKQYLVTHDGSRSVYTTIKSNKKSLPSSPRRVLGLPLKEIWSSSRRAKLIRLMARWLLEAKYLAITAGKQMPSNAFSGFQWRKKYVIQSKIDFKLFS